MGKEQWLALIYIANEVKHMNNKWYIVWEGHTPGVYDNWGECKRQIHCAAGARYKSYKDITRAEAEQIYQAGQTENQLEQEEVAPDAIAVDASVPRQPRRDGVPWCGGGNGRRSVPWQKYPLGTNNMGEFLAIVHAMAYMAELNYYQPIYTDSATALKWVQRGKCQKHPRTQRTTALLWQHMKRAETVAASADLSRYQIRKWTTKLLGEIPADFGRKNTHQ